MKKHICKFCSKEFETGSKLGGHVTTCKLNPNYEKWLRKTRENLLKRGPLSEETKKKISKSRTEYLKNNPDQVPYRLNHSSKKSWIEKVFEEYLVKNDIKGWVYNYNFSIYRLDFAFPEWKLDIELDGATHQTEKVKLIDEKRNEYLVSEGWRVLRFTGKEIKYNVYDCIQKVCNELKNDKIIEIPIEFLNKKYEKRKKKEELKLENSKKDKEKIEKEKIRKEIFFQTINDFGNIYGIVDEISKKINISPTHVRRLSKTYNVDLFFNSFNKDIVKNEIKNNFIEIIEKYGNTPGIVDEISKKLELPIKKVRNLAKGFNINLCEDKICKYCNKYFEKNKIGGHLTWCSNNPNKNTKEIFKKK